MQDLYNSNKDVKGYVDRYRRNKDVSVEEVLGYAQTREVADYYREESKDE